MSASAFVQLPYGVIENQPTFKFKNQKNYETNNYLKTLPYLDNVSRPEIQNDAINLIKNKASFRNYLLATSDVGSSLQDAINHVVTDGEFNEVGLRRVLDSHNSDIFKVSNPLSLVFKNAHTFNLKNPVLGNLVSQIYAGSLSDENIKKLLLQNDIDNIQTRLDNLKRRPGNNNNNVNNDDDDNDGGNPDVFLPDVPDFEPQDSQIDKNIQRENPKQIAPRERVSFKTALSKNGKPVTVQSTSFAEPLPQVKVRVKDGLTFDNKVEVDGKEPDFYFEKFPDSTAEDYRVSFDKPATILKEDGVIEVQPEINFEPDINPVVKKELENDENPKGFHKFKDIDVSDSLKLFFPKLIEEKPNSELIDKKPNKIEINDENLKQIVKSGFITDDISSINETFFVGGSNWHFEKEAANFRNESNQMFINFLQSDLALELMTRNKIKIHISSGDIYVNNVNTNESIYNFLAVQDNENYVIIPKEFIFDGSLTDYYNTYLTDNSLSVKDDFTTNRNSKFLFLHFNNVLQMTGVPTYKLRHTVVIQNQKSIELMQKSNWQYFIETLMYHAENNLLHSVTEYTEEEEETIRPYIDKLLYHGEVYKEIHDSLSLNFHSTFQNLPEDYLNEIFKDLRDNNIYLDFRNITPKELIDVFLNFYYFTGRFPGNTNLTLLPSFNLPKEIDNSIIDFSEFYFKFKNTYFEGLASIQGICALCKYISKDNKSTDILIKNTIEELLNNLIEENLNYFKGKVNFRHVTRLLESTINNINNINYNINAQRDLITEQVNKELNEYKSKQKIEEIVDSEIVLLPTEKEKKFSKNEDYVNELNKFLVEVEPTVDGIKKIRSEDQEKLSRDLENEHIKINDKLDEIERNTDENEKITVYDLPEVQSSVSNLNVPNINDTVDGINSNNNILYENTEENSIDWLSDVEEPIQLSDLGYTDGYLLDLDQNEQNIKLGLDNNLNIELKPVETELGFLTDFPSKDNLGEQPSQILDDEEINNNVSEEMDTNYKRIVFEPDFEEFGPNLEKYLKKNRQIDTRMLRKKREKGKSESEQNKKKAFVIPEKYPEARTLKQSMKYLKELNKDEPQINFEEFAPNIEKYIKKNRQIDVRKLNETTNSEQVGDIPTRRKTLATKKKKDKLTTKDVHELARVINKREKKSKDKLTTKDVNELARVINNREKKSKDKLTTINGEKKNKDKLTTKDVHQLARVINNRKKKKDKLTTKEVNDFARIINKKQNKLVRRKKNKGKLTMEDVNDLARVINRKEKSEDKLSTEDVDKFARIIYENRKK